MPLLLYLSLPSAAAELEVHAVKLTNNAEFRFRPGASEVVRQLPISPASEGVEMGATSHYELFIDERDINARGGCDYFSYVFYARRKPPSRNLEFFRFPMKGYPVGVMQDDRVEAAFTLEGENGRIVIPVFGCTSNLVVAPTWEDPIEVSLASGVRLPLHLKNPLANVSILLHAPFPNPQSSNEEYWRSVRVRAGRAENGLLIPPNSETGNEFVLEAIPRPGNAFIVSLFSLAAKKPDDHLSVLLTYSTRGGMTRPLSLDIPIRFVPWPPVLFLAVAFGNIVGLGINSMVKRKRWKGLGREILLIFLISIIVEIMAMVLRAHNSELRILGFDLDPYQLLPAALLGSLVGMMGFEGCKAFVGLILNMGKPLEVKENAA